MLRIFVRDGGETVLVTDAVATASPGGTGSFGRALSDAPQHVREKWAAGAARAGGSTYTVFHDAAVNLKPGTRKRLTFLPG